MSNIKATSFKNAESTDTALNLIRYIASDTDRLGRFCALSGLTENDIKTRLNDTEFLAFVFDYALQDENLLVGFANEMNLKPERFVALRNALPGAHHDF